MAKARAGWERKIYRGTAGSTVSTQMDTCKDVDVRTTQERSSTKVRGTSAAIPKETQQVTSLAAEITFTMEYDDGDAHVAAIMAAVVAGTALAIKTERVVSGSYTSEFDGDCTFDIDFPGPLTAGMEVAVTATPTKEGGRTWTLA